ncbi:PLP-dependent aminotransferase family protein [Nocardioides jiangxiensis]|uniref:PLP-dependent aminotransferase family protein n=1 Tax=Nocardioides jiangxiensis TaxID=3064524 RepID=A0ABT9AYS9_9ACTN|nr:PLP-dependent aminotransferase family protein [Nocardioides sp. WY-20]MDO7867580.1 PLP-dependent aminotransferase family protein [Nocardioides sp. WY-20]
MSAVMTAGRIATLVDGFDRSPAYAGLSDALRLLIGEGRIPLGARLPSERDLTVALDVSRTTVTRAYADLRERGFAEARTGSGTFTRLPGGRRATLDRGLAPLPGTTELIDLNCAAGGAPTGLAAHYEAAVAELPAYLGGHGYFPAGLPALQEQVAATYAARGLPTEPDQVLVTAGALSATAIAAQALTSPGDRLLVDSPVYPNATSALTSRGARLVTSPVDAAGFDVPGMVATVRQAAPRAAFVLADFQNPTGHVMAADEREEYAAALRRNRVVAIVDEAHQALALDAVEMPPPFASFLPDAIAVGSASKQFWGGLRLGWIRAPRERIEQLTSARLGLDLGAPLVEQLVLARVLADPEPIASVQRDRLRTQRDALVEALRGRLPEWRFRVPAGGLCLWVELPAPVATVLAGEAERQGASIAPGSAFAVEGGLERFIRLPWTRPADELRAAVDVLAASWEAVADGVSAPQAGRVRVV